MSSITQEQLNLLSRTSWLEETRKLLQLEYDTETSLAEKELDVASRFHLQNLNLCVASLRIESLKTGLYGRIVARFISWRLKSRVLSSECLSSGDIVRLVPNNGPDKTAGSAKPPSGIVSRVSETYIEVAFDGDDDIQKEEEHPLRLDKLPNDSTHRRQNDTLDRLERLSPAEPAYQVARVLFGESSPTQHSSLPVSPLSFFNEGLNEPQQQAVEFALRSRDVALIHGPPGTGKTFTLIELIRQATQVFNLRVLVCAPSNVAVDNIILRLAPIVKNRKKSKAKQPIAMVRLGHPARLLPQVLEHCLDAVVKQSDASQVVNDVRSELDGVIKTMTTKGKRINYKELRSEAKTLRKELRTREHAVVQNVVKQANVVLATNAGAVSLIKHIGKEHVFDIVIIDEAAQAIEASCWIPILFGRRVVLAGDHQQLPPTIKSDVAARGLLGTTLFDRVVAMYGDCVVKFLSIQYRMNRLINDWASHEMYQDRLLAHESVSDRKLSDFSHLVVNSEDDNVLVMIDTAYCGFEEAVEGDEQLDAGSRYNQGEADIVKKQVEKLCLMGLKPDEIAVITPYNAQVHLLRSMLLEECPKLEIRSVDGFQGREKEAVILSLVRSNKFKSVGFLSDNRRLNVAITRAKRYVCVVCDSETISSDKFLGTMVKYFQEHGECIPADLYMPHCSMPMFHIPPYTSAGVRGRGGGKKKKQEPLSEERIAELRSIVEAFATDAHQTKMDLPSSLKPSERFVVHEIAEGLNLVHVSSGVGRKRFIHLEKDVVVNSDEGEEEEVAVAVAAKKVNVTAETENVDVEAQTEEAEVEVQDEDDEVENPYFDEIQQFVHSKEKELKFPSTLSPPQRLAVHEAAQEFNLIHESFGTGKDRFILVKKKPEQIEAAEMQAFAKGFIPKRYQELLQQGVPANEACALAVKQVQQEFVKLKDPAPPPLPKPSNDDEPKTELEKVREIMAARHAAAVAAKQESSVGNAVKQTKTKKKKKKKKKAASTSKTFEQEHAHLKDDDEFLDSLLAAKKQCAFTECTESVITVGSNCEFCKHRFCFKHGQAEVHGCGASARAKARQDFTKSAHVKKTKPLQKHQRSALRRQLADKITEENQKRSRRKNSSSKKS